MTKMRLIVDIVQAPSLCSLLRAFLEASGFEGGLLHCHCPEANGAFSTGNFDAVCFRVAQTSSGNSPST